MKNIFETQDNIKLYDEKKMLRYKYYNVVDYQAQITYDSNGGVLTFEDSERFDALREFYKEFPLTKEQAFKDEANYESKIKFRDYLKS
jgi:hypothetical protein